MGVAARPRKMRNYRVRCLKIPSQEEDRQWTQQCQSRVHQETSAQTLGKELALVSQHSVPAASGCRGQRQPAWSISRQSPISGPATVGSTSIRYACCQQHCLWHGWENRRAFTAGKCRLLCCLWSLFCKKDSFYLC